MVEILCHVKLKNHNTNVSFIFFKLPTCHHHEIPRGTIVGRGRTGGRTVGSNGCPFGSCVDPGTGKVGGGNTGIRGLCIAARCC